VRIGIDVGGTHTDAAIVDGGTVVASYKAVTSMDITSGILEALNAVVDKAQIATSEIRAVMLGTTQFTNAVVERRHLTEAAVIRLCLPAGECLPPMVDWPGELADTLGNHSYMAHGGNEYNGEVVSPLDEGELNKIIDSISESGARALAISASFSPLHPEMEIRVADLVRSRLPGMPVVLSHELGRLGILERENAALLNASLLDMAQNVVSAFENALAESNINAPFFVSQNDGTIMHADTVRRFPILTFSSGPTNSMRGAAHLSGIKNAIVADVGGTTTDVGMLISGFPRESSWNVEIGGVRSNFRMPDILAIGLGGGSLISESGDTIGPQSVGNKLNEEAICFGGNVLTATDIGVASGIFDLGDRSRLDSLAEGVANTALSTIQEMVSRAVEQVKTGPDDLPLIVVGGGEFLIGNSIAGISEIHRPPNCEVANAVGAALAQVSGECEILHHPRTEARDKILAKASELAKKRALANGAMAKGLEIISIDEIPIPYMAEETVRIHARAVGNLDI